MEKVSVEELEKRRREEEGRRKELENIYLRKFREKFGEKTAVTSEVIYNDAEMRELCLEIFRAKGFDTRIAEERKIVPLVSNYGFLAWEEIRKYTVGDKDFYAFVRVRRADSLFAIFLLIALLFLIVESVIKEMWS